MKRGLWIVMVLAGCAMAATHGYAQAAPANTSQQPAQAPAQTPAKPAGSNPFPEDTTNVPVMPSTGTPALPPGTDDGGAAADAHVRLPGEDMDDDTGQQGRQQGKHRKLTVEAPEHTETSAEDIQVGEYELDIKNWKAALSRFESAMVLAPDEPEVYWGLAECERHLGKFAEARGYYQKVAEYDPDSRHGKEAIKALKAPEIANAKAAIAAPGAAK
jgi:tetratricopeptide (TPR) repeat protein